MKICYLARSKEEPFPRWYEYFIKKGHEVHLISGDDSHINLDIQLPEGIKLHSLPEIRVGNPLFNFCFNFIRLPVILHKLKKIIREVSPDIIHAHQITPFGLWAALSDFHPFVITPIGSDVLLHARKHFVYGLITRYVLNKADLITGDSIVLEEAIEEFGGDHRKNHIIQNGVNFMVYHPEIDGSHIRTELNLGNKPVIFSPRSFTRLYNIDCIIKAIPDVLHDYPDAIFLFSYILTDMKEEIKSLVYELNIQNSVRFLGMIKQKDMPFYYAAADICVSVPSSDSSPGSVYEAMACATPVILSDLPWTKHFIRNEENALIVPVKSPEAIAKSIIRILQNKALSNKLIEDGLSTAKKYVDYHANMRKMEMLMEDVLGLEHE